MTDDTIEEKTHEKEFGNEKNRLVIQPVGLLVIEFLIENFTELFNYDYTKNMEDRLDVIAKGDMIWYNLCYECHNEIKTLTSKIPTIEKTSIKIDDQHTYIIGKNGPVIKCTNGDHITFKSVSYTHLTLPTKA